MLPLFGLAAWRGRRPARFWRTGLACLVLAGSALAACEADRDAAPALQVPGTLQPANFPAMVYGPERNPPSPKAFELGRALFYDPGLSVDGTVSCGSCHQQQVAFADANRRLSQGVGNRLGARNAPALQNLRWRHHLLWDGGAAGLEIQALVPLTDHREMGETLRGVLAKLNADAGYRRRFAAVYGPGAIDTPQLLQALAQFTAALTSANSRYDRHVRGEAGGALNESELRGRRLFAQKCGSCHATDLFTDESFRNNGLNQAPFPDSGRQRITHRPQDLGRFGVPTLRNVALTAPYMHDGRFQTLEQVLAHYDRGVQDSPTLDPLLRQPDGRLGIPLSAPEQADLLAFLHTLTDADFVHDPRLSPPAP